MASSSLSLCVRFFVFVFLILRTAKPGKKIYVTWKSERENKVFEKFALAFDHQLFFCCPCSSLHCERVNSDSSIHMEAADIFCCCSVYYARIACFCNSRRFLGRKASESSAIPGDEMWKKSRRKTF